MAPSPEERQDEVPPDPAVAPPARPAQPVRYFRLLVPVPLEVQEVCQRNGQDLSVLLHGAAAALVRKLTPQRGPADKGPYAGEICYFERLLDTPSEALTLEEQLFVILNRTHEALRELTSIEGSDAARGEVAQAIADLADWVTVAQGVVRRERGEDAPRIDWEVTEP